MTNLWRQFKEVGLNLNAVFDMHSLPNGLSETIFESCPGADRFESLILLASSGSRYWECLGGIGEQERHPVDHFVISQIEKIMTGHPIQIVYPGDHLVPLVELGQLAGWHHTSPLGLGIHPEHGPWYAYRAVILTNGIKMTPISSSDSPCSNCCDKPCISACPAGAVNLSGFDVDRCSKFRLGIDSPCADKCLARLACPVGKDDQYTPEQMKYHYGRSLEAIRRYAEEHKA